MSACNFTINFNTDAETLVQKLQIKVTGQGGNFSGDANSGTINVPILGSNISGSYTIVGQQITIVIDNKPFLLGCGQIQNYLAGSL